MFLSDACAASDEHDDAACSKYVMRPSRRDWIVDRDDSEPPDAERYAGWLQGAQSPRDAQRED